MTRYLVTTNPDRLPSTDPIAMVDGTVPNWQKSYYDLHFDHHKPGGAKIQVDEMPMPRECSILMIEYNLNCQDANFQYYVGDSYEPTIVTTMVDADACVAAAWLQLTNKELTDDAVQKLRAIAHDCDHLRVSDEHLHLKEFAAKAVAALKTAGFALADEMGYPSDRRQWTERQREAAASAGFKQGTEWLIAAVKGERPWPGEMGEADDYYAGVMADADMLLRENRVYFLDLVAVCNTQGIGRYIDPRAAIVAWQESWSQQNSRAMFDSVRPETLTIRDHKAGGASYTLGSFTEHPLIESLDYTVKTFAALTAAEIEEFDRQWSLHVQESNASGLEAYDGSFSLQRPEGWGGRATVGGSAWNTPSLLSPPEVVAIVLAAGTYEK